jgi:hypothetical protein
MHDDCAAAYTERTVVPFAATSAREHVACLVLCPRTLTYLGFDRSLERCPTFQLTEEHEPNFTADIRHHAQHEAGLLTPSI